MHANVVVVAVQLDLCKAIEVVDRFADQNNVLDGCFEVTHGENVVSVLEQDKGLVDGCKTVEVGCAQGGVGELDVAVL